MLPKEIHWIVLLPLRNIKILKFKEVEALRKHQNQECKEVEVLKLLPKHREAEVLN